MRLDISSKAQKWNTEIPEEKVSFSETKEIGSQNLGPNHTNMYFCIHVLSIPLFFQHIQLRYGKIST